MKNLILLFSYTAIIMVSFVLVGVYLIDSEMPIDRKNGALIIYCLGALQYYFIEKYGPPI